jgi:hypothetical protein
LNRNETEKIQDQKRKRNNKQTFLVQEDSKKCKNETQKEYNIKSQEQYAEDNHQNYFENNKYKMKSIVNIFSNLTKHDETSINLNKIENTRSEKRKRFHQTTFLEEYDEQKETKKRI